MSLRGKRVLITCGPTWMAMDPMRILTNRSTGRMGQTLALRLKKCGARVTLLEGPVAQPLKVKNIRIRCFRFFDELSALLNDELPGRYEIIIHAAAVADYRPVRPARQKIPSGQKTVTWRLTPTKKLIKDIRQKAPQSFLVGFKWESDSRRTILGKRALELIKTAGCDLVVANTTRNASYQGYIVTPDGSMIAEGDSRENISQKLVYLMRELL